jgi:hypothetical protein
MQLLCLGDVAFAHDQLLTHAWKPPGGIKPDGDTKILLNWELPVGNSVNPLARSSGDRLVAHPASVKLVQRWAPGLATLATNHVLDAGEAGLAHTLAELHNAGFATVGAGLHRQQITSPLFWQTAEGRLAVVNWVFAETHPDWLATPGPNCWPGLTEAGRTLRRLKREADWVLVVPHWSDEHFSYPRPEERLLARDLARMGADLVVGHHPHVVRGAEVIGTCPVFYSLGNFYFAGMRPPRNREALGLQITFRRGKAPRYRALSFWQVSEKTARDPLRRAGRRLRHTSRPLQKLLPAEYEAWYAAHRARFDRWGGRLHFGLPRLGVSGSIRYALNHALSWPATPAKKQG